MSLLKYSLDPAVLHEVLAEVATNHAEGDAESVCQASLDALRARYPGRFESELRWVFSNAGGSMGQMAMIYATLTEYLLFFNTPVGGRGHSGRYPFVEEHFYILRGEQYIYHAGELEPLLTGPGGHTMMRRGQAHGFSHSPGFVGMEYVRGPVITLLPFGVADTVTSTLDGRTLWATVREYGRNVLRALR